MRNLISVMVFIKLLILASFSLNINAQALTSELLSQLKTFNGESIVIDKDKITHLVFIDLWRSYGGQGDEQKVAALPSVFLQQSQQLWLQPEVNVTKAQLVEFQQYFPQVTPLLLDQKFSLMRAFKVWQSPYHILIKGNETLFSGDEKALLTYISKTYSVDIKTQDEVNDTKEQTQNIKVTELTKQLNHAIKPYKPVIGDNAPHFSAKTITGEQITLSGSLAKLNNNTPLNLVFLDALCPMPHFPGCEEKIAQLNTLIKTDKKRQWLGVVNSYYVNEEYVQKFAADFSLELPLLFDKDNTIYRAYDVYASPYLIKVDRQGIIESRSNEFN